MRDVRSLGWVVAALATAFVSAACGDDGGSTGTGTGGAGQGGGAAQGGGTAQGGSGSGSAQGGGTSDGGAGGGSMTAGHDADLHSSRAKRTMKATVITSFADQTTEDIFHGAETKAARVIPKAIWTIARRKLDALNAAHDVQDLRAPPGNRLEKLQGKQGGKWSIRINDQFRVVFRFESGAAHDVQVTDYH